MASLMELSGYVKRPLAAARRFLISRNQARIALLLTAILIVGTLVLGAYLRAQMGQIAMLRESGSSIILRPVAQAQRELLRLIVLIETYDTPADLDAIEFQQELATSRYLIVERHHISDALDVEIVTNMRAVAADWLSTEAFLINWMRDPSDQTRKTTLIEHLNELELQTNRVLQENNRWIEETSAKLTRRHQQMFIFSQLVGVLSIGLGGIIVYTLARFSAELQQNEQRLRKSETRYQLATQAGQIGIWELTIDTNQLALDPQLVQMVNATSARPTLDEMLGRVREEDRTLVEQELAQLHSGDSSAFEIEIGMSTKSAELSWLLVRGQITDENHVLGTVTDVSERRSTEEAALEAQRLESLGVLVGGIAHDFNNLLTGMMGQQSVALFKLKQNPAGTPQSIVPHLEKALHSAERAADLTRQLLDYSGKNQRLIETIDLNRLLRDNRELFDTFIDRKTELRFNQSTRPLSIEGDKGQVQQVLMNLVINAAEASSRHASEVTVSTSVLSNGAEHQLMQGKFITPLPTEQPYAQLVVADSGAGMSAQTIQRIFDPFFTTKSNGRGLGLSATLGVIKSHGGALHLHSVEGVGTTFTVLLPLVADAEVEPQTESEELIQHPTNTVLVIEDEAQVRDSVRDLLELMQVRPMFAENGREGVDCYQQHADEISLAIVDMQMPIMDGAETILMLKQINPDLKIILMSATLNAEMFSQYFCKCFLHVFLPAKAEARYYKAFLP